MASNNIQQEGMLPTGTTLQGGKYRIEHVLGQGGFGITYLAKYTSNGRKVAIKELFVSPKGQAINSRDGNEVVVTNVSNQEQFEKHKAKFKKEATRLAQYHHPNIVKVSEFFEENGTAYYVMSYIEGESLRNKLIREDALPESVVMNYLRQILSALEVIHRDRIWHLDIKPENIMVDTNDKVYLIDFGASKHIIQDGTLTTSSMMAYTPGYYPPEQLSSTMQNIGAWSDIYSLGATLYNLMTSKNPPTFDSIFSEGKNAFSFTSKITSETRNLIVKMMNPNRNERLRSVFEVRDELEKDQKKEEPIPLREETIVEKPRRNNIEGGSGATIRENRVEPHYQAQIHSHTNNARKSEKEEGLSSGAIIGIIAGVIIVILMGLHLFQDTDNRTSGQGVPQIEVRQNPVVQQKPASSSDIYRDRVNQFVNSHTGVIASFPNDNRYSVYYSKSDNYGRDFLYCYDAVSDNSSKLSLPIEATTGEFTSVWLTKNRYIFVLAEYRYADFIRIDTKTNQVKYITDCDTAKRTSKGFTITKSECINEYEAECEADKEYAYRDYYYNEEGVCTGSGSQYER